MKTEWLTIQSFQQSQELIDAINTLSIHLKLKSLGIDDGENRGNIQQAREKLSEFLKSIDKVMHDVDEVDAEPLTGVDPRFRQFIRNFVAARKNSRQFNSSLFKKSLPALIKLLESEKPRNTQMLLDSLSDLRILLEEHIHSDTLRLIGDI